MTPYLLATAAFLLEAFVITVGTIRVMFTVQGRSSLSFAAAIVEVGVWIGCVSMVLSNVAENPLVGAGYVLGFACGNVLGIAAERKIAMGHLLVRFISRDGAGDMVADVIRKAGYGATLMTGEGGDGEVSVLFVVCRRRDLGDLLDTAKRADPDVFHTFESVSGASNVFHPERKRPVRKRSGRTIPSA